MRPLQTILVLETLASSMRGPIKRDGLPLCPVFNKDSVVDDRATVVDVYIQWICLLLDLGYLSSDCIQRDARRILEQMFKKDVLDLVNAMTEALLLVRVQEVKGFKRLCGRISSHLYHLIRDDIRDSSRSDYMAARRLVQLFSYMSRLSLRSIDLSAQCVTDYQAVESSIDDNYPESVVQFLNQTIRSWMKDLDTSNLRPCHGPGGVADVSSATVEQKYRFLSTDKLIEYAYGEHYLAHDCVNPLKRRSRTIFVPKSYKTFRTISLEPATLQYLQQGVWAEIRRLVDSKSFLRNHIGFTDQTRNQRLALEGSRDRNYATIDLSAASDSVSYGLVKKVFKGTKLLKYLMATRSRETVFPGGAHQQLKKFAPMGSALCFPIETLIFAAACQFVTLIHGVPGDYSCYGDDLVVPTQCVGSLIHVLGALGFRVNREKSYFLRDVWFRESCGAEYCNGFDVTPIRVSRGYMNQLRLKEIPRLIPLANAAFRKEYWFLRAFFVRRILTSGWKVLFAESSLLTRYGSNYHLEQKWSHRYQCLVVKVNTLAVRYGPSDESIRYRHWLEKTQNREILCLDKYGVYRSRVSWDDDYFVSNVGYPTVVVRKTWVFKPLHMIDYHVYDAEVPGWSKSSP